MRSSMLRAGEVLILVGSILAALGAVFLLLAAAVVGPAIDIPMIGIVYGVLALISAVGSILGFVAYGKAKAGDARGAFVMGLIGSLLPPVQVVLLIGAILCKVSPEGDGSAASDPSSAS